MSVAYGLTTAICWGSADYLSRSQSHRFGHYRTVLYSHSTTLLFLALILATLSPPVALPVFPMLVLVLMGILNLLGFLYLYRAFHLGRVSIVAPVAYTYPATTIVLSVLVLGETIGVTKGLGIAAVIAGVILLSTRFSELFSFTGLTSRPEFASGLGSAIAASVLFGTVYVGMGYATPLVGYAVPPIALRGVGVAFAIALAPVLKQKLGPVKTILSPVIILMGALESAGFLLFNFGIFSDPNSLPVIASLSSLGGAVAALYAMLFLKERFEWNQVLGFILSIGGVLTLLYIG